MNYQFAINFFDKLDKGYFENVAISFSPLNDKKKYMKVTLGSLVNPVNHMMNVDTVTLPSETLKKNVKGDGDMSTFIIRKCLSFAAGYYSFESVFKLKYYLRANGPLDMLKIDPYNARDRDSFCFKFVPGNNGNYLSLIPKNRPDTFVVW